MNPKVSVACKRRLQGVVQSTQNRLYKKGKMVTRGPKLSLPRWAWSYTQKNKSRLPSKVQDRGCSCPNRLIFDCRLKIFGGKHAIRKQGEKEKGKSRLSWAFPDRIVPVQGTCPAAKSLLMIYSSDSRNKTQMPGNL